ncbi:MAG: proline--tRNA ligase [Candidatus Hepatoplasma vulgare]|nr:MAG: proline--tRNA ligase [Candidatus Hepatoplasma sp.]
MENNKITLFEEDVSKWYSDIVLKSKLVSYAPVKGTLFFSPYGFSLWNNIKKELTKRFSKLGVEEVIFPSVFPLSYLKKEEKHVEGFSPEIFLITNLGEKKLDEALVLRPTSEVLFNEYFKNVLQSYNQLPIKLNQWVSVFRAEKNTKPFLRNSEFLWQEGHTTHASKKDAEDFAFKILDLYENFLKNFLLLPLLKGKKTKRERFAGAEDTYAVETILKDGQALQVGTSHYLSNNFSKVFNVRIQGKDGKLFFPFQTSWAVSTRLIGALVMSHSDNNGLILPSKIAPYQIVISTIFSKENNDKINDLINKLKKRISNNFNILVDTSDKGIGFKIQNYEVMGIPLRIEIGNKELLSKKITITKRADKSKTNIVLSNLDSSLIKKLLLENDKLILENANKNFNKKIKEISNIDEIKKNVESGFVTKCYWEDNEEDEKRIKEKTGATIRIIKKTNLKGKAINSSNKTNIIAYFARAY